MAVQHAHDIDGHLHDPCPACDIIRERKPSRAEAETRPMPRVDAEKMRLGKQQLEREGKSAYE